MPALLTKMFSFVYFALKPAASWRTDARDARSACISVIEPAGTAVPSIPLLAFSICLTAASPFS